jgi:FAD/FMN-containing dehydrogenase
VIDTLPGEFLSFAVGIPFDEELAAAITTHLGVVRSALAPYDTQRTYLNFTEKRTDPAEFFGTANYVRLRAVKAEVDPHERLVSNHPIRPS